MKQLAQLDRWLAGRTWWPAVERFSRRLDQLLFVLFGLGAIGCAIYAFTAGGWAGIVLGLLFAFSAILIGFALADREPPGYEWARRRGERDALTRLRQHQAALGYPVDHLSDAELLERVNQLGQAANAAGVDADAAARAVVALGKAAQERPTDPGSPHG